MNEFTLNEAKLGQTIVLVNFDNHYSIIDCQII